MFYPTPNGYILKRYSPILKISIPKNKNNPSSDLEAATMYKLKGTGWIKESDSHLHDGHIQWNYQNWNLQGMLMMSGTSSLDKISSEDGYYALFEAASGCILHRFCVYFQINSTLIKKSWARNNRYSCLHKNEKLLNTWFEKSNMHSPAP